MRIRLIQISRFRRLIILAGLSTTLYSASPDVRTRNDSESCMMAERLNAAKSAVVSIHTFTIEDGEVWSRVGSGWIYNSDGLIVTRQSVVQGSDSIEVLFFDGRREPAAVLDCDPVSQVAVLKTGYSVKASLKTGKAYSLKKNECVILLGNSLGVFPSVTLGHLLEFQDQRHFIFTGSVPPGNSGGPIFNRRGQLIGMLAGRKKIDTQEEPVGVAVPFETIDPILKNFLSFARKDFGWMGLYVSNIPPGGARGVRIVSVIPDGPADRASICPGDTLVAVDGRTVGNVQELSLQIKALTPRSQVTLDILRQNVVVPHVIEMGQMPLKGK